MGSIVNAILGISLTPVLFVFGAVIGIIGFVSVSFFQLVHGIFNWVITDIVFNVPLTETVVNGNLTFVGIGWTFTRDLANMFFILVLVFIAIATILKINDYEAKKALPRLILMAFLINFSPVIVGIIVDFFNILMNFFLSGTSDALGGWADSMGAIGSYFGNLIGGVTSVTKMASIVAYGITLMVFYFLAALVFGLIAIIFLARIIAIWILVILAPIAFWGYILPATRSWWSTWWKQLTQWSFIGATMAFFLYLGAILLKSASVLIDTTNLPSGGSIATIFPYFISLGFLIIGIVFGLNSGAAGANMVIKAGKSVPGRLAKTRVGQKALAGAATGTQKVIGGTEPFLRGLEKRVGKIPVVGGALKLATAATTRPFGYTTRGLNRLTGAQLIAFSAERQKIQTPKGFENWSAPMQEAWAETQGLSSNETLTVSSKMGENLKHTSSEWQSKAKRSRDKAYGIDSGKAERGEYKDEDLLKETENMSYMQEAGNVSKVLPGVSEAVKIKMKLAGKGKKDDPYERQSALNEAKKEIKETADFIKDNLSKDDLTIETGLKLKYINKEEADLAITDQEKTALANKVRANKKYKSDQIEQFLKDTSAGAAYVKEFKSGDIGKIANTKALSTRTGLVLGNPNNLQRVLDEHGKSALSDVFEGPGGLNSRANTPTKLQKLYEKNPSMVKALMTNLALRHMYWEGRNQMLNPNDQQTNSFADFEKRMKIEDEIIKAPPILKDFNNLHIQERKLKQDIDDYEKRIKGLEIRGLSSPAEMKTLKDNLKDTQKKLDDTIKEKDRKRDTEINTDPDLKRKWEEIEALRRKGKRKP